MTAPESTPKKDSLDPLRELIRNPAARVYLAVAGGGLAMTVLILFQLFNSSLGAAVVFAVGILGLMLRWTAMPAFIVCIIGYTVLSPFGVPIDLPRVTQTPASQFRIADVLLVASVLTYLLAQYRLLSILHAAVPFESAALFVKKKAKAAVRPPAPVSDGELGRLFLRVGAFTLVGQLLWYAFSLFQVDFQQMPPVKAVAEDSPVAYFFQHRNAVPPPWLSRSLLAIGLFVAVGVAVRLAFWFWRHHTLGREQAKLLLLDLQWAEHRREIDRQESWRAWMVDKLNGTSKPRSGCGTLFMVIGLPAILLGLFWLLMMAAGCVKS